MSFLHPELLLLLLPVGWALWQWSTWRSLGFFLRAATAAVFVLALAGPHGGGATTGRDLVVVVDRSRSMPASSTSVQEVLDLLESGLDAEDRVAILSFGADTVLDKIPGPGTGFAGFVQPVDPDGSHLAEALDQALALVPRNRPGSILLFSDGEFHGADPEAVARRAAARGLRVDVRSELRPPGIDVAVEALGLPEQIAQREPFQFSAWVRSDSPVEAGYVLFREGVAISRGSRQLRAGLNQLLFRDLGREPGLWRYRLEIEVDGDRTLENNRGIGVVRVEGVRPLLLVNDNGVRGRLAGTLQAAGFQVEVRTPEQLPLDGGAFLESFRGVVLENVAAERLGRNIQALGRQVEDLGGGLLVTGGRASFGVGGYYRSDLDPLLPVTMEIRQEHRKVGMALAVVLDRSGSMSVGVGGGLTKMDLANAGTMEAIRLLGRLDEVAVIAVDSEPHVIVQLTGVEDPQDFASRVSGIQSMGGGIFTYTGLLAAATELEKATRVNRHVILFADANDAEEPGQYKELLDYLIESSTTVSVVALGTDQDSDAEFLRDVAKRGAGEVYFTTSASELPRLFAQDTLLAARASFVDLPTGTRSLPGLFAVSSLPPGPWATLNGYNLTYLRPGASLGVATTDEYAAPVVATLQAGLGRTAAFTGQAQGEFAPDAAEWPAVAEVLVTVARWIGGQEAPAAWFPEVRREGREAVVSLELDRDALAGPPPDLELRAVGPDGQSRSLPLAAVARDRFEARIPLGMEGVYRFAARAGADVIPLPALAVPYSPEFEPRTASNEGARVLGRIARLSGGRMNPPAPEILRGRRAGTAIRPGASWFALAGLLLLLCEIAWRRLFAGSLRRRARADAPAAAHAATRRGPQPRKAARAVPVPDAKPGAAPRSAVPEPREPDAEKKPSLGDALRGAKSRSRDRTGRRG